MLSFLKKALTGGAPPPAAADVTRAGPADPRPVAVDEVLSSAIAAKAPIPITPDDFARRLVKWCVVAEIKDPIDWPNLYVLSHEFAKYEGLEPVSKMTLAKALARIGIPKTVRDIEANEAGVVSYNRSDAKRPRVTVYHLPQRAFTETLQDQQGSALSDQMSTDLLRSTDKKACSPARNGSTALASKR